MNHKFTKPNKLNLQMDQSGPTTSLKTDSIQKIEFTTSYKAATKIGLSFEAISDPSKILELEQDIDRFVTKWSKNPFLLSGFIIQFMRSSRARGWTPIVLIVKADEKIVGIVPFTIKTRLGLRFANILVKDTFSSDFVFDDRYQEACMGYFLEYLFKTLNCQFVESILPTESQNLKTIEQQCKVQGIGFSTGNQWNKRIISVESTWDEFQGKKGRRRKIRQIENKMDEIGPWRIEYIEKCSNRPDVLKKLLDVEKMSWKASEPAVIATTEEELLMSWKGSQIITRTKTDFNYSVWFLQINRETIAYTFVIRYKGTAFIVKTSYDERYKKCYVGKYINNIAIRDMFNEGQITTIDFMSEFPFMSFWTNSSSNHVRVSMRKGNLVKLMKRLQSNTFVLNFLKTVSSNLPNGQKSLAKTLLAPLD
jgi:hypothetical protein